MTTARPSAISRAPNTRDIPAPPSSRSIEYVVPRACLRRSLSSIGVAAGVTGNLPLAPTAINDVAMRSLNVLLLVALLGSSATAQVRVTIQTELGDIDITVDSVHAPVTSANFLRYVYAGRYAGGQFHRTVTMANQESSPIKIEVVQLSAARNPDAERWPAIELERTNKTGLK